MYLHLCCNEVREVVHDKSYLGNFVVKAKIKERMLIVDIELLPTIRSKEVSLVAHSSEVVENVVCVQKRIATFINL